MNPGHRDAAPLGRSGILAALAALTTQSFQKCIDDKISSHSAPVARGGLQVDLREMSRQEKTYRAPKTTASRSEKSFCSPGDPACWEAGRQLRL
jgi:hypothetical protein